MRLNSRTWFVISLLLFAAAALFWQVGESRRNRGTTSQPKAGTLAARPFALLTREILKPAAPGTNATTATTSAPGSEETNHFPYRLRNTSKKIDDLARSASGILLQNAFIDTANGVPLVVPSHLRAASITHSYIVQGRGAIDVRFRAALMEAGAAVVAYIPNNAYLVRAEPGVAQGLSASPLVQAVRPFDPYFKLEGQLLPMAVKQEMLPLDAMLRLTIFPDEAAAAKQELSKMGVQTVAEDRSPFGPVLIVQPPSASLVSLANLDAVQGVEIYNRRGLFNDLARERLGVATNTTVPTNYNNLTGKGVLVGVNDTGVDELHPDLRNRVFSTDTNSFTLLDLDGHGTHVAGTIASSGKQSSSVKYASGSVTNADFRGKAPEVSIFILPIDLQTGPLISDSFLQETAARTNAFISNNSWGYPGVRDYDSVAASYDAAVRDALPEVTGSQPILYVFAAGNSGSGSDNGFGGIPGTVTTPGTAKNVITVGAIENLRSITNEVVFTNVVNGTNQYITNQVYYGMTDSDSEVASFSSRGNVGIGLEGEFGRFKPDIVAPGTFVVSTRASSWKVPPFPPYDKINEELNDTLKPYYRYESGTSMATPAVSGVLALMQEYFEQRMRQTNSPALMKALLINGARSVDRKYDFYPRSTINYQGWGLLNLTNAVPLYYNAYAGKSIKDVDTSVGVPHYFFDQSTATYDPTAPASSRPTSHALATGQTDAWNLDINDVGALQPLRVTLVWTDPPGNPVAAIKLVNDLDLIVSNTVTHEIFFGNNFPRDRNYNDPSDTNNPPVVDFINNVENVYLPPPLDSNYVVSVFARRVNVNAVTANTNDIVQDYALVISAGNGSITNSFRLSNLAATTRTPTPVIPVTNGVALLDQRVGANFPLTNSAVGQTNQWNFYIFTNTYDQATLGTLTNGSNVAFVTFLPPNVGSPRNLDADIDLYVSTNPALTNLDPAVINSSFKSVGRGGSQVVFFTNALPGTIYYVGVKSEDQQGGEFALYGISSDIPFTSVDENGNQTLNGFPIVMPIPDGSPEKPGVANIIAIGAFPVVVGKATVHNEIFHESVGDLVGTLTHQDTFVVLNNHFVDYNREYHFFEYDDSNSGARLNTRPTDGPGSLNSFVGSEGNGLWLLTMADNAPNHIGTNLNFSVKITPAENVDLGLNFTVQANRWVYYYIDVPADAIRLTIQLAQMTGPLDLFLRFGDFPDTVNYDKAGSINPPGGSVSIGVNDVPPLNPGRYYIGVFNPNATPVSAIISAQIERNPRAETAQLFTSTNTPVAIPDQALLKSDVLVDDPRSVVEARVGVRIDHSRLSDLVLHLVSPEGTRVLLVENRGGTTATNFGAGKAYASFTDNTNLTDQVIKFASPPFSTNSMLVTNLISGFEGLAARGYTKGEEFDGWKVQDIYLSTNASTGGIIVSLPTVISNPNFADSGTNYLGLGRSRISRDIPTRPGELYTVTFSYRTSGNGTVNAQVLLDGVLNSFISGRQDRWQTKTIQFTAGGSVTRLDILPAVNNAGMLLDSFRLIEESGNIYFFPEEPLDILKGESALGRWSLEVLDNRAGPVGGIADLLSWQLQLVLTRTNAAATKVEEDVPIDGTVSGGEIKYFIVDVPRDVTMATNIVFSAGDMVLLYSADGLPNGNLPGDVLVDNFAAGGEILVLNTNTPPVLQPGQRYYLGVANFDPAETNDFTLLVTFQHGNSSLIQPTVLQDGVARNATLQVTNAIDYYQFTVSSNAYSVTFETIPQNGDVDMIIRRGLPVRDPLPTPNTFDFISNQPGTNAEEIVVTTNSFPVALTPGVWYIGVYNPGSNVVNYSIRATEALNPYLIIPLRSGVPVNATQTINPAVTNFFLFSITNAVPATVARFDLYNVTDASTLFLNKDFLFDTNTALYQVTTGPAGAARIFVTPTGSNTIDGEWFSMISGYKATNVSFTVRATLFPDGQPLVTTLSNDVTVTNYGFGNPGRPQLDYYRYNVSATAKLVDFELFPLVGNVDLLLMKGPGLPTTGVFDYASENAGQTNEIIRVGRGSSPVSLTPGEWIIAAYNRESYISSYAIRITETEDGKVQTIDPDVVYSGFATTDGLDYYRIAIPPNTQSAFFQLNFPNAQPGQLQMYLRKGLPLATAANAQYTSQSGSPDSQSITLTTASQPIPLSAGDWYLSVTNKGPNAADYRLVYSLTGTPGSTNSVEVDSGAFISNNAVCVTWTAVLNSTYQIEGKPTISQTNWVNVSPLLTATSTSMVYCIPFTDPNHFFRVMQRGSGGSSGTGSTNLLISPQQVVTNNSFCLTWNTELNSTYRVEGKATLSQTNWVAVSPVIIATATNTTYCVPLSDTNRFFRVVK